MPHAWPRQGNGGSVGETFGKAVNNEQRRTADAVWSNRIYNKYGTTTRKSASLYHVAGRKLYRSVYYRFSVNVASIFPGRKHYVKKTTQRVRFSTIRNSGDVLAFIG